MSIWTALARFAVFETERLHGRPLTFADGDCFFDLMTTPEIARFILPLTTSRQRSDAFLVSTYLRQPLGTWGLTLRGSETLLGIIRLERFDEGNSRAELTYVLRQEYWGQGLMTEAVNHLTSLAFREFGLREVVIVCHLDNLASQKVAEKAGFQLIKRYRASDRYSRQMADYLSYHLTRRDYRYE